MSDLLAAARLASIARLRPAAYAQSDYHLFSVMKKELIILAVARRRRNSGADFAQSAPKARLDPQILHVRCRLAIC